MNDDANQDEDLSEVGDGTDQVLDPEPEIEPEVAVAEPDIGTSEIKPQDLSEGLAPTSSDTKSSAFMGVPIEIIISVGKARPLVSDLVKLRRDSVIALDSKIDDPVEIFIGDRLIARGELQEMESEEGQLGVRLTEVADLSNGV